MYYYEFPPHWWGRARVGRTNWTVALIPLSLVPSHEGRGDKVSAPEVERIRVRG
jgi:hypothetical protein